MVDLAPLSPADRTRLNAQSLWLYRIQIMSYETKSQVKSQPEIRMLQLDRFLPYLVNKLASRLSDELAAVYQKRFGITIAEWRVIAHLAEHQNVSIREIFVRVAMDKSKVSRAAARLELSGFIQKSVNPSDRRLLELQLTAKGRKLFEKIEPLALAYEREALSALSPQEAEVFQHLIHKLLAVPPKRK